jgi:hypothetical protein
VQHKNVVHGVLPHEPIHQRKLRGARVTENTANPFLLEDLEYRLLSRGM